MRVHGIQQDFLKSKADTMVGSKSPQLKYLRTAILEKKMYCGGTFMWFFNNIY